MTALPFRGTALRIGAVLLLVAVYAVVWRPARPWLAVHAVGPFVAALASEGTSVQGLSRPPSVRVRDASGVEQAKWGVPAGMYFILPAILLVAVAPHRPLWLVQWIALVGLGVLALIAVLLGVSGAEAGFVIHEFLSFYVIRVTSIALPLYLVYEHLKRATSALPGQ